MFETYNNAYLYDYAFQVIEKLIDKFQIDNH